MKHTLLLGGARRISSRHSTLRMTQVIAALYVALGEAAGGDLMAATRYGVMMLRFASTKAFADRWRRKIEYPKLSIA